MMSTTSKSVLSAPGQTVAEHPVLNLLLAWKNFMVMVSRYKVIYSSVTVLGIIMIIINCFAD